jgi:hypothetical protein
MKNFVWLLKLLTITLSFLFLFSFVAVEPVYSRGGGGSGCFGGETSILTPEGSKAIEQLHPGDRIISYNFSTHHQEEGTIGNIEIISSPDYYLINHQTKVTGTHPFYLQTTKGIRLSEVQNLRQGNRSINSGNGSIVISSIEHIPQPISVYNLISINPNHNFYADGFLVHNKGSSGGGGGFLRVGRTGGEPATIKEKTLTGFIEALIILFVGLSVFAYWRQIYNFIRFFGTKFTEDSELIKFATNINANFKNKYSIWYQKDDRVWQMILPQSELEESKYQDRISKAELVERVSTLFFQYQHDWTVKDFESMTEYILEPFYSRQKQIFQENFGNDFDIVYDCKLFNVIPIEFETNEKESIFRVQINAEMINFTLSIAGYILSGESYLRSFSEYWDIGLGSDNNWYLIKISQINIQN